MTKRLSPEQIADLREDRSDAVRDLLGHIEAIEAELATERLTLFRERNDMNVVSGERDYYRDELAEAKAEIARLKEHTWPRGLK